MLINLDILLNESLIKNIFYQMLCSIRYCHDNKIIHRDVKIENFLVNTTDVGQIPIKLNDFGLAFHYTEDKPPSKKYGSIISIAPEMLKN